MHVASRLFAAMHRFFQRGRGQRHNRRAMAAVRHLPDSNRGGRFVAVDDWHLDIHQDQVELAGDEFVDRLLSIFGFFEMVGSFFQVGANERAVVLRIVGHQNLQRAIEERGRSVRRCDCRRPKSVAVRFDLRRRARAGNSCEQLGALHWLNDIVIDPGCAEGQNADLRELV